MAKHAAKSVTILGGAITFLGAALPTLSVELANMPPSPTTRWLALLVGAAGAGLVAYGRTYADTPVRWTRRRRARN